MPAPPIVITPRSPSWSGKVEHARRYAALEDVEGGSQRGNFAGVNAQGAGGGYWLGEAKSPVQHLCWSPCRQSHKSARIASETGNQLSRAQDPTPNSRLPASRPSRRRWESEGLPRFEGDQTIKFRRPFTSRLAAGWW